LFAADAVFDRAGTAPDSYDVNALSNFVTDAPALVGFDPHARFARWLRSRASGVSQRVLEEALR
jgi:hypothetical protein